MGERHEPVRYPRLSRRIEAVLIDSIILSAAFFGAATFISSTGIHPFLKIAFVAFFPFVLEPCLVSVTGATIGHRLRGLKIQRADTGQNLNLGRATLRFLAKTFLGVLSLFLILLTKRRQAIHDLIVRSVVILRNPSSVDDQESLPERAIDEKAFIYPSKWKRIAFISAYAFGGWMLMGIVLAPFTPHDCTRFARCPSMGPVLELVATFSPLAILLVVIVFGWRCQLWGCRPSKRALPPKNDFVYPSGWRRIIFTIGYVFGGWMLMGIVFGTFMPRGEIKFDSWISTEPMVEMLFSICTLAIAVLATVLGWRYKLWGCRPSRRQLPQKRP